jgi:hypothetical protein
LPVKGVDEAKQNTPLLTPCAPRPRNELGAVVDPNLFRPSALGNDAFEHSHNAQAGKACVHFDGQRLARKLIHNGQAAKGAPAGQRVADKVHRPALIGSHERLFSRWRRQPPCAVAVELSPHSQSHRAIQAVNLFVVHLPSLPTQHCRKSSISEPLPLARDLPEA